MKVPPKYPLATLSRPLVLDFREKKGTANGKFLQMLLGGPTHYHILGWKGTEACKTPGQERIQRIEEVL